MQEEVVALQHRWPLPQQHQLCARASGDWRGVWGGIALGTGRHRPHPRTPLRARLEQVGMKGSLCWSPLSPCIGPQ